MELKVTEIPQEFRKVPPLGFRLEKRGEHEFLIVESIFCPHGHSLLSHSVKIHGEPSIKLRIRVNDNEGIIFVDSFWGSHAKLFGFLPENITPDTLVEAFCPVCGVSLMEEYHCEEDNCHSTRGMYFYLAESSNKVHVCARLGCPGHDLDIVDISHELVESLSAINYFGTGADDIFGDIS